MRGALSCESCLDLVNLQRVASLYSDADCLIEWPGRMLVLPAMAGEQIDKPFVPTERGIFSLVRLLFSLSLALVPNSLKVHIFNLNNCNKKFAEFSFQNIDI